MNISQTIIKSLKKSFGAVTKYAEIIRLVPDDLKTKKMCKNAVKKVAVCNEICSWLT